MPRIRRHALNVSARYLDINDYSHAFAERLFSEHPEWRDFGRRDPEGFPPPGSLLVDIPSPVSGRTLRLRTYGDQVTIDFGPDGWHTHFGVERGSRESAFDAALACIRDLISERVVVTTRWLLGRRLWTRAMDAEHVRQPKRGRLAVYSWTGRLDAGT